MKDTECQAHEFAINLVEKGELEVRNHWSTGEWQHIKEVRLQLWYRRDDKRK